MLSQAISNRGDRDGPAPTRSARAVIATSDPRLVTLYRDLLVRHGYQLDVEADPSVVAPGSPVDLIGALELTLPTGLTATLAIVDRLTPAAAGATTAGVDEVIAANAESDEIEARLVLLERRLARMRGRIDSARRASEERSRELLAEAQRQAGELELLHEVRTALARDLELPALFRAVVEATASTFGYQQVSVYLLEDGHTLVLQHQVGYNAVLPRIPVTRGVSGRVARTGQPILLEDVSSDPEFLGAIANLTSEVCVPFFDEGRVAGIFNIETVGESRLGEADLRLMTAVGEHLGLAVQRARLYEAARQNEDRLRLAFEAAAMGTWDWDAASGQVRWSAQMGPLYGLPPGTASISSEKWYELVHPADRAELRRSDARIIRAGDDYDVEFRVVHPNGVVRWLAGLGRTVERNEKGEAVRLIGVTMDVTGRKRLEEERLRLVQLETARAEAEEAQHRITDILERITAGFVAVDVNWCFTYVNERAAALIDRPRDELLGTEIWSLLPPDSSPEVAARLRQAALSQEAVEFDVHLDANNRWLEIHVYPAPDGLSIYLQDTTDRVRAAEELRRSEERFRSLVQNASDIIMIIDRDGTVRYASPAVARVLGVPPEEVVGSDNVFRAHPDDRRLLQRSFVRTVRTPGVSPPIELRWRRHDGSWVWLEVTATNLLDVPGMNGIVANCRDVTERRRAEDDLRFLAETSAWLASSLDPSATLKTVARLVVDHFADWAVVDLIDDHGKNVDVAVAHRDPALEARVARFRHLHPVPLDAEYGPGFSVRTGQSQLYATIDDDFQTRAVAEPAELAELREFGFRSAVVVPLISRSTTLGALSFVSGTPNRYGASDLHLAEEVARRAALAIDNARLYHAAREAIQARDQFLSVAAHELRTPITAITGFGELLRREVGGEMPDRARIGRFVNRLTEAGGRLSSLVDDVLDVSRIRLGQLPLRLQPVDLAELVEHVALGYQERHLSPLHRFRLELPSEPLIVTADDDRLQQVLSNLLENAVKYMPAGGEARVILRREPDRVRLVVQDEGIGLPAGAADRIFEPFGRASNATAGNLPGLGLGLFICRNIVERHGGQIWAESDGEGKGTQINVLLPLLTIGDDDAWSIERSEPPPAAMPPFGFAESTRPSYH